MTTDTQRRKQQPTAQTMREQLALAADTIIALKTELANGLSARYAFTAGLLAGAIVGGWLL